MSLVQQCGHGKEAPQAEKAIWIATGKALDVSKRRKEYSRVIKLENYFDTQEIEYVNLLSYMDSNEHGGLFVDHQHFNSKGHEIVAELLGAQYI